MIILHSDGSIERVEWPEDYTCDEWKAYESACIHSEQNNLGFTEEMGELYAKYIEAAQRRKESEA